MHFLLIVILHSYKNHVITVFCVAYFMTLATLCLLASLCLGHVDDVSRHIQAMAGSPAVVDADTALKALPSWKTSTFMYDLLKETDKWPYKKRVYDAILFSQEGSKVNLFYLF